MQKKPFSISRRMSAVQDPIIPVVSTLIQQTPDTLSLGQGIVYYPPPDSVIQHVNNLNASADYHFYSDVEGLAALRSAIAEKLQRENNIKLERQQLLVSAGANMAFMNAILAILDPGDEVILLKPFYFNHEMAIKMVNAQPVPVATDAEFQPDLERIQAAITGKTRAIVTVSPNNPTGAVYSAEILTKINQLCEQYGLYHISDEAYEYFTYDDAEHFSPASLKGSNQHTIAIYSLSKAYGYASWRIGYMLVPEHLLMAIKKVQDTYLICPARIAQEGAMLALKEGQHYCQQHLEHIAAARTSLYNALKQIDDICYTAKTKGAFYFLLRLETQLSGMQLVEQLIKNYKVAGIPGETFGMEKGCYLRVAYAALTKPRMQQAISRLLDGLNGTIRK